MHHQFLLICAISPETDETGCELFSRTTSSVWNREIDRKNYSLQVWAVMIELWLSEPQWALSIYYTYIPHGLLTRLLLAKRKTFCSVLIWKKIKYTQYRLHSCKIERPQSTPHSDCTMLSTLFTGNQMFCLWPIAVKRWHHTRPFQTFLSGTLKLLIKHITSTI